MSRTRDHSKNALGWYVECNLEYIKTEIYVSIYEKKDLSNQPNLKEQIKWIYKSWVKFILLVLKRFILTSFGIDIIDFMRKV